MADWYAAFEERAAIAQYDGGLERADAEFHALQWLLSEFADCLSRRDPVPERSTRPAAC
jgi:hypothetical protein